jgi:transposase
MRRTIVGGVDTHLATHQAAVLTNLGEVVGSREFAATRTGYESLLTWMRGLGDLRSVGIEGTGSYGAGLARHLLDRDVEVFEVPRPDRRLRRQLGKSDPVDAEAAARAVLSGGRLTASKVADGPMQSIRMLRVARSGALKARTAATNSLRSLVVTAPEALRMRLRGLTRGQLVTVCRRFRGDGSVVGDPEQVAKIALRSIAERVHALGLETSSLDRELARLAAHAAPNTMALFGLGPDSAGALLVSIGDNPDRLRSESAFARLAGVAPIPASSGQTRRHRLHRGGNRAANSALHVAVVVRLRYCPRTRAYADRRRAEGLSMSEIIRCLKRYLAREVFVALRADYALMAA